MARRYLVPAVAAVLAVALAACGGPSGSGSSAGGGEHGGGHAGEESIAAPVEGAQTIELTAVDIDYKPATMTIPAGEPVNVSVTNDGDALHDFTLEEGDVHFDVPAGETKESSLTVDEPGTYQAICSVAGHAEAGMTIDVTVE